MESNRHSAPYPVAIRELGLAHHLKKSIVLPRKGREEFAIADTHSKTSEGPTE